MKLFKLAPSIFLVVIGFLTISHTAFAVNSAPVLDAGRTPGMTTLNEDASAPSGVVGTLVSSLVDFAAPTGQVDNITDTDGSALLGIAVTATDTTNFTCYYSTGGAWNPVGVVSDSSALLLAANSTNRIYCRPNTDVNGSFGSALTFRAWDQTTGADGDTADVSSNGGAAAFSSTSDDAVQFITAVNDAPVLDAVASPVLRSINEQSSSPTGAVGTLVSSLVDSFGSLQNVMDVDSGASAGIAIVAADTSNGTYYYTVNGGATWSALGAVSATTARLLAANSSNRIYFQPAGIFSGAVAPAITFRAWDQSSGTAGGLANTSTNGGTAAFSSATDTANITVLPVNHAPVLDATKSPILSTIAEDASAPSGVVGNPISNLVDFTTPPGGLDNITDTDDGVLSGIAITVVNANFSCFYSLDDGVSWSAVGSVSNASAKLIGVNPNNRIYCQPNADVNGSFSAITFRAWDQTNSNGGDGDNVDTTTTGGSSAFSTATDTASITISAVNDNPTANDDSYALLENAAPTGLAILNNDTDIDNDILSVLSITSPNHGGSAILGNDVIIYTPATDFVGTETFSYTVSDGNGGTDTGTVSVDVALVDTTAPDTFLLSDTPEFMTSPIWGFLFDANEQPVTFECSLDSGGFSACTSPYISSPLALGPHTFAVRAIDGANNTDASPATASWTVISNYTLESVSPADGTKGVATNTPIVFRFADPVHSFLRDHIHISSSPCTNMGCPVLDAAWSENNTVLTYTKAGGPFKQGTTYTLRLGDNNDGVIDIDVYNGSFTTRSISVSGHVSGNEKALPIQNVIVKAPEITISGGMAYHFTRTLKFGLQGDDVVVLQKILGITPPPSKNFGPLTKAKLIQYQKDHGLVADGIAGPKTFASMIQ